VFGVKDSLLVDLQTLTDAKMAEKYDVELGSKFISYNFVLVTDVEAQNLREKKAIEAMAVLGKKLKYLDGLPVPDLD
jgi:hypothetical protein